MHCAQKQAIMPPLLDDTLTVIQAHYLIIYCLRWMLHAVLSLAGAVSFILIMQIFFTQCVAHSHNHINTWHHSRINNRQLHVLHVTTHAVELVVELVVAE